MGLDDRPPHRKPSCAPHPQPVKFHTAEFKKPAKSGTPHHDTKYATAPANLDKPSGNVDKNKKILVSLISQSEYMKRHLYIKTGVDHERSVLRYQLKKVSIRNYTPKAINQDINMGMWI